MPQKFLHLNCFFTCGMIASNLPTFCSIVLAVGGCTRAPRTSASLVRAMRSLIAFAWSQLLDLTKSCDRSEEHTSELQSLAYLVCRLLLEKKKKNNIHLSVSENGHAVTLICWDLRIVV